MFPQFEAPLETTLRTSRNEGGRCAVVFYFKVFPVIDGIQTAEEIIGFSAFFTFLKEGVSLAVIECFVLFHDGGVMKLDNGVIGVEIADVNNTMLGFHEPVLPLIHRNIRG